MKKIYIILATVTSVPVHAASTDLGRVVEQDFNGPRYLIQAADAWDGLIGQPLRGGRIATYMDTLHRGNEDAHMYDVLETLAFNHTTMTILQSRQYMDTTFDITNRPLTMRRRDRSHAFVLNAEGLGAISDFDASKNNNYKFHTSGAGLQAYAYVADGYAFGVGYTYNDSKSRHMPAKTDATAHTISIFSKYLSPGGLYINTALAAGRVQWDIDKTIAGVKDDTSFNTDTLGAELSTGITTRRGRIYMRPEISVQYMRISTEHFIDGAAQSFKKWWYNTMTAGGDVQIGADFAGGDIIFSPNITLGAGYDILHNGTDHVRVGVVSGDWYDMPVESPNRTGLHGGLGLEMYGANISGEINYRLDSRSNYIAHTLGATVKIAF